MTDACASPGSSRLWGQGAAARLCHAATAARVQRCPSAASVCPAAATGPGPEVPRTGLRQRSRKLSSPEQNPDPESAPRRAPATARHNAGLPAAERRTTGGRTERTVSQLAGRRLGSGPPGLSKTMPAAVWPGTAGERGAYTRALSGDEPLEAGAVGVGAAGRAAPRRGAGHRSDAGIAALIQWEMPVRVGNGRGSCRRGCAGWRPPHRRERDRAQRRRVPGEPAVEPVSRLLARSLGRVHRPAGRNEGGNADPVGSWPDLTRERTRY